MTSSQAPVIQIGRYLVVCIQDDLSDESVEELESRVVTAVAKHEAEGLLIDVSQLAIVDSYVARILARIASVVGLLGARSVIVGIRPAVAITLVELGLGTMSLDAALDVRRGIALLDRVDPRGQTHDRRR